MYLWDYDSDLVSRASADRGEALMGRHPMSQSAEDALALSPKERMARRTSLLITSEMRERALDAAFEAKGRELSYTEEGWLNAALDALANPAVKDDS